MLVPALVHKLEMAFGSTWRTPAASRTWTDVTARVDFGGDGGDVSVRYGRQDERGTADANELTITLDNTDGAFTYKNTASPFYPNVRIGLPVRFTASLDGESSVRFVGYVNELPTTFPGGSDRYVQVTITASSAIARLGTAQALPSPIDKAAEQMGASYYWPLTEAESAAKGVEISGRADGFASRNVAGLVVPGSDDLGLDGRTGWRFTGTSAASYGSASVSLPSPIAVSFSLAFFAKVLNPAPDTGNFSSGGVATGGAFVEFLGTNSLVLRIGQSEFGNLFNDGRLHHFCVTTSASGSPIAAPTRVYIDGTLVLTSTSDARQFTGFELRQPVADNDLARRDMTFGRVSAYRRTLTAAEVEELARSQYLYANEEAWGRLNRLADWAAIPSDLRDFDFGRTLLAGLPGEGGKAIDLMRTAETTDQGVLYDSRAGALTYRSIRGRYNTAPALTVDMRTQRVKRDYAPRVDRSSVINVARVRNSLGTAEATFTNEASRAEGEEVEEVETASVDILEPYALATWLVNSYAEPQVRVGTATLNVVGWSGDGALASVLALDVGSKVRLTNQPSQAGPSTVNYIVEGYTETFSPGRWEIALNLSPVGLTDNIFRFDDPVLGRLDSGNVYGL